MTPPELLRVRAKEGVDVSDWRVPARHGQRAQYLGRDLTGKPVVSVFYRTDGSIFLNELRRVLLARDLLPADEATARWSGAALPSE